MRSTWNVARLLLKGVRETVRAVKGKMELSGPMASGSSFTYNLLNLSATPCATRDAEQLRKSQHREAHAYV